MALAWFATAGAICLGFARQASDTRGPARDEGPIVARGGELVLHARELERVLLERYAMSKEGRDLLRLRLSTALIDSIAQERGLAVGPEEVTRRWKELDGKIKASGESGGLAGEIRGQRLGETEFREYLRLTILHERLTRQALGLSDDASVSAEQQEIWLDQEMRRRGLERFPPPWKRGPIARCGEVEIDPRSFGAFLRRRLPEDDVRETAWHLLLLKGLERRMPQLSPEAMERGIEAEIQRRREKEAGANPGLSLEQVLGAQGRTLEGLRHDPSVRIATLSRMWVDQTQGAEGLRRTYEREREFFEGRHGEAVHASMIFLGAARFRNQLNPRTYEDAERELEELKSEIGDTADFAARARRISKESGSRDSGGDIGWVTRLDPRFPSPLREALFAAVGRSDRIPPQGFAVGPIRLPTGSALLWVSEHRPSPSWELMSRYVHEELRRRLLVEILPKESVEMVAADPAEKR